MAARQRSVAVLATAALHIGAALLISNGYVRRASIDVGPPIWAHFVVDVPKNAASDGTVKLQSEIAAAVDSSTDSVKFESRSHTVAAGSAAKNLPVIQAPPEASSSASIGIVAPVYVPPPEPPPFAFMSAPRVASLGDKEGRSLNQPPPCAADGDTSNPNQGQSLRSTDSVGPPPAERCRE